MKPLVFIIAIAIIFVLTFVLYMAHEKIKSLEKAKENLREEKSKLSDALRRKGIQVDGLLKKIKRLEM